MKITEDVLMILDRAQVAGNRLVLPPDLDRGTYVAVNKVLEAIGGKWNRGAKSHLFDGDAADVVEVVLETGEYSRVKQDLGQFDTPPALASKIAVVAQIMRGMYVLEPSAGIGNLALAAEYHGGHVTGFEIDAKRLHKAKERCEFAGGLHLCDFLSSKPEPIFDVVVMNPPFGKQVDILHAYHATRFLKSGGRLVSVMSAGVMFRENRASADFRAFVLSEGGKLEKLPTDSFAASGTNVNTCLLTIGRH